MTCYRNNMELIFLDGEALSMTLVSNRSNRVKAKLS